MEAVLDVDTRPYDPRRPLICMDETNKQLLRDARLPRPPRPGQPARVDYEYEREGVANLFVFCEPLAGQRWVDVTEHRTKVDWAHQIKDLVEGRAPPGDLDVPPAQQRGEQQEETAHPLPHVLVVLAGGLPRFGRQRRAAVGEELLAALVQADQGVLGVGGALVDVEDVLHRRDEGGVALRGQTPVLLQPGLEFVFLRVRRTASRLAPSV